MTCQNTTYLSHKTWPDLIMRIKHLKVTCSFSARRSPLSPVTSFSLGFQLRKVLEVTGLVGAGFKGETFVWFGFAVCHRAGISLHRWFTELDRQLRGLNRKFLHPRTDLFVLSTSVLKSTFAIFHITHAASICTWPPLDTFCPRPQWNGDKSAVTLKEVLTPGLAPMNCTVASISCSGSCVRAMRTRGRCDTLQSGLCRLPGGPIVCLSISYACSRSLARSQLFLHVFGRYTSVEASASPRLLLGRGMHLSNQGQAWRGIRYNWSDVRYSLETSCCQQD